MYLLFYNFFIQLYIVAARLLGSKNKKARLLIDGRNGLLERISRDFKGLKSSQTIWMHCASLGEFEQGRPLLEALKNEYPTALIVLTFFSPSGYEVQKNFQGADYIYYLPFDTARNAKQFIDTIQPNLAIFVKYELWYHYLRELKQQNIPVLLISAIFQERHAFFKWYGGLHRKMLQYFSHIFVQNDSSRILLKNIGVLNVSIAGDSRIDRALAIAQEKRSYPIIETFKGSAHLIVAGSTWSDDEALLAASLKELQSKNFKLLIAPHEIDSNHLGAILELFEEYQPQLYSQWKPEKNSSVLIIDNIGHLAFLYRYASIVWIGGGFNKTGIHNSIEAAVYGKTLAWGPRYSRYQEAIDLIKSGAAASFDDSIKFASWAGKLQIRVLDKEKAEQAAQQYIDKNKGATSNVISYIKLQNIFS
jgi:3-deoxy-D-manno-octulosonic-acid transferase